jgi:hypothetical protein
MTRCELVEVLGRELQKVFNSEADCFVLKRISVTVLEATILLR